MKNRNDSVLDLPQLKPDYGFDANDIPVQYRDSSMMVSDRRRMIAQSQKQLMAIEAVKAKSFYGLKKISEMDQYAQDVFKDTADYIVKSRNRAHGTGSQEYIEEFSHYLIQMSAQHMLGALKISSTAVAYEIARSPYPPEITKQKGFWARVFGV